MLDGQDVQKRSLGVVGVEFMGVTVSYPQYLRLVKLQKKVSKPELASYITKVGLLQYLVCYVSGHQAGHDHPLHDVALSAGAAGAAAPVEDADGAARVPQQAAAPGVPGAVRGRRSWQVTKVLAGFHN